MGAMVPRSAHSAHLMQSPETEKPDSERAFCFLGQLKASIALMRCLLPRENAQGRRPGVLSTCAGVLSAYCYCGADV